MIPARWLKKQPKATQEQYGVQLGRIVYILTSLTFAGSACGVNFHLATASGGVNLYVNIEWQYDIIYT
jgi:hypothetical protein